MLKKYLLVLFLGLFLTPPIFAHHVLGRPAYSLNEDSNTPPSMAVETQLGQYFITYMVFPAFPKANEPGRLNLYAARVDNGKAFQGEVSFYVRDNSWSSIFVSATEEKLGSQKIDDGVYRQGFVFNKDGNYIIRAYFESDGEPYSIDFPLQVGEASPIGIIGLVVGLLLLIIVGANLVQTKKLQRLKIRSARKSQ